MNIGRTNNSVVFGANSVKVLTVFSGLMKFSQLQTERNRKFRKGRMDHRPVLCQPKYFVLFLLNRFLSTKKPETLGDALGPAAPFLF